MRCPSPRGIVSDDAGMCCRKNLSKSIDKFDFYADKFEQLPMHFMNFHGQESIKTVMEVLMQAILRILLQYFSRFVTIDVIDCPRLLCFILFIICTIIIIIVVVIICIIYYQSMFLLSIRTIMCATSNYFSLLSFLYRLSSTICVTYSRCCQLYDFQRSYTMIWLLRSATTMFRIPSRFYDVYIFALS